MMILFFGGLVDKLLKLLQLYSNRLLYREKARRECACERAIEFERDYFCAYNPGMHVPERLQ